MVSGSATWPGRPRRTRRGRPRGGTGGFRRAAPKSTFYHHHPNSYHPMNADQGYQDFTHRVVQTLQQVSKDFRDTRPLSILVMGPKLEDDEKRELEPARLRRVLINECKALGNLSVMAEHPGLRDAVQGALGAGENLTIQEFAMAKQSDLIVIIPASAGSIAELGYFAFRKKCCNKMIILFSKEYEAFKDSYLARGPGKAAKNYNAKVEFVNYSRPDEAWDIVRTCIEVLRGQRIMDRLEAEDR